MPWLTDLPDVLRRAGLDVVEVQGWRSRGYRGRALTAVRGIIAHHTATSARASGDYPTLRLVRDGRSDLPGPLAQLGLGRSGTWYVIAAGLANHAGRSDQPAYGNSQAIGIEAEHPGAGAWPAAQYDAYVRGCAALQRHYGTGPVRGHKETAVPKGRKTDPNFDMAEFRRRIAAVGLGARPAPAPPAVVSTAPGFSIQSVQEATQALGGDLGSDGVDGVDGPLTQAAVRVAQKALGVAVDGVWGPKTQEAYMHALDQLNAKLDLALELLNEVRTQQDREWQKSAAAVDALGRIETEHGPGAERLPAAVAAALADGDVEATGAGQ